MDKKEEEIYYGPVIKKKTLIQCDILTSRGQTTVAAESMSELVNHIQQAGFNNIRLIKCIRKE